MLKKITKTLLIVIVLIALGLGAYWFFDKQQGGTGDVLSNNGLSIGDFFPFGTSDNAPTIPNTTTNPDITNPDTTLEPVRPERFWQISKDPQSGAVAFNASNTPTVRFVDTATGNVFESPLALYSLERITNTTIPKVYEAMWQPNASAVTLRYLNDANRVVRSTYSRLVTSAVESDEQGNMLQELQGKPLPDNIKSLSVNSTNGALAYLVENAGGSTIFVTDSTANNPKQVFNSPIKDFRISWIDTENISLLTKPNVGTTGYLYFLKTSTGQLTRVMGDKNGLSALVDPTGTKIAFSENIGNSVNSGLFNVKTGETISLPIKIIPEKCVWARKSAFLYCAAPESVSTNQYPDAWYKGLTAFSDTIWRVDTSSQATELILDPNTKGQIDAINLKLDPNEEYLLFTNKTDSQLWGLKINRN